MHSATRAEGATTPDKRDFTGTANELLSVKDVDRDQFRLLAHTPVGDFAFVISAADVWQIHLD